MLSMKRSTAYSPRSTDGTQIFYIRTFTMSYSDFIELVEAMFHDGIGIHEQPMRWLELIGFLDPFQHARSVIHIRYLGTSGLVSAWQRFQDDLRAASRGSDSFLYRFLDLCTWAYPEVIEGAGIHELPEGRMMALVP
jgi:hypothetical protein